MRQRLLRWFVVLLPFLGFSAATIVGLARIGWPNPEFWAGSMVVLGIIVAGVVPLAQSTISEMGERRQRRALEREDDVRSLLTSSLVVIARECDAPWDQIGVQAFVVTGWLWRKRQERLAKVRLSSIASSGVVWSKGKGVIGMCWETRSNQWVQLDDAPFCDLSGAPSREWPLLDAKTRYGLSFEDYQSLGKKYGTVAAVPMIGADDTYIGCITLDTPAGVRLERSETALSSLAATADMVRRLLGRQ